MWSDLFARAAPPPPSFDKGVELALRLKAKGKELYVPGDHVEALDIELRSYGYAGVVRFFVFDDSAAGGDWKDDFLTMLSGLDPIELEVSVRAYWQEREHKGKQIRGLSILSLVGERALREARDEEQSGRHHRAYTLHFFDPAYLLWHRHFPTELFTQKSVKQLIEAHKPEPVKINITSQVASTVKPLLFLGHTAEVQGAASFYDWLIWYTDTNNLKFYYDYVKREYVLADAKAPFTSPDSAIQLDHGDIANIDQRFAEVLRAKPRVHNICVAASQTQLGQNAQAMTPLYQDHVLRVQVAQEVEQRSQLETKRLYLHKPDFTLHFARLPVRLLLPGDFIDLKNDQQWKKAGFELPQGLKSEASRIRRVALSLRNRAPISSSRAKESLGMFRGTMVVDAEPVSETAPSLPPYVTPTYPRHVEGQILVEEGADNEETYQVLTDKETSVESYRVGINTWANQEILAPFDAHRQPGHFYFPAYKHETVLVAFYFDRARIEGFVDWRAAGARVPKESQGNHLLMGKTSDNNTSVRHIYEDNKPVFTIHRTNKNDHQLIQIREGYLLIQVREEPTSGT